MKFTDGLMEKVRGLFGSESDELLFFVLVFLLVFGGSLIGNFSDGIEGNEGVTILFFIIMFIFLFISSDRDDF